MAQKKHSSVPVSVSESLVPPNRWCTIEIVADGPNITISIDGKQTAEYHDTRFTRGAIGLQQHIAGTVALFRKVEVMELPG